MREGLNSPQRSPGGCSLKFGNAFVTSDTDFKVIYLKTIDVRKVIHMPLKNKVATRLFILNTQIHCSWVSGSSLSLGYCEHSLCCSSPLNVITNSDTTGRSGAGADLPSPYTENTKFLLYLPMAKSIGGHGNEKSFTILKSGGSNVTRLSVDVHENGSGHGEPGGQLLPFYKIVVHLIGNQVQERHLATLMISLKWISLYESILSSIYRQRSSWLNGKEVSTAVLNKQNCADL